MSNYEPLNIAKEVDRIGAGLRGKYILPACEFAVSELVKAIHKLDEAQREISRLQLENRILKATRVRRGR